MPHFVSSMDAFIIPLKDIPLFEGAIPSKIFENLAMEKPILLGVKGEAKQLFIEEGNAGLYFQPEHEVALKEAVLKLTSDRKKMVQYGKNGRVYVDRKFNRNDIASQFLEKLKTLT